MWAKSLRLNIKKISFWRPKSSFFFAENVREGRNGERDSNFSLRSTETGWLKFVGPRMKVQLLDEGYAWVSKTRDFVEDSSKEFGKSKVLGLGSV